MILLLDNFDSFTYNLADYLAQCGAEYTLLRNNISLEQIKKKDFQAIVLSPGPQTPEKAGNLMQVIDYYIQRLPILGICLGHQAIGRYFGAALIKAKQPMHGKISPVSLKKDYIFEKLPRMTSVVRYHSLVLENIQAPLEVIALSDNNEVMAIRHQTLPLRGIQFHPEAALTIHGMQMIENWIKFNQIADEIF